MFSGHNWWGSLQMLLQKWSTSYLRSTMLKHKPHKAKLKVTATNSLPSITPRLRSSSCAPGTPQVQRPGSAEPHLLHSQRQGAAPALTGGCARRSTRADISVDSRPQLQRLWTGYNAISALVPRNLSSQTSLRQWARHRCRTYQKPGIYFLRTVRVLLGTPTSYRRWWFNVSCSLSPHTFQNF